MIGRAVPYVVAVAMLLMLPPRELRAQNQCAVSKVAVVRTSAIFASIDRFTEKTALLDVVLNNYHADVSQLQGTIDSTTRAFREKSALISAAARQAELTKLERQTALVQQRIAALERQARAQRDNLLQPIETGVQAVVDSVRVELRCAMVIDASMAAGVASVNRAIDVTDRVIDRIKATGDTALFGPRKKP